MGAEPIVAGTLGLEPTTATSLEVVSATGSDFAFCSTGVSCGADVLAEVCKSSDSDCWGNEIVATGADIAGGGNGAGEAVCVWARGFAATRSPNWMIDAPNCLR